MIFSDVKLEYRLAWHRGVAGYGSAGAVLQQHNSI